MAILPNTRHQSEYTVLYVFVYRVMNRGSSSDFNWKKGENDSDFCKSTTNVS